MSLIEEREDLVRAVVEIEGDEIEAVAFPGMTGPVVDGNEVIVNTTGLELDLGTGGVGFVLWNLDGPGPDGPGPGHIVKMRYTPWQTEVLAAEAPESDHHAALEDAVWIDDMPVVACGMHSQVAGVAAGVKAAWPEARVGYLMTDGGALPIAWSRSVTELKRSGLLDTACTVGHAFGGDFEAVNVFSGLAVLERAAGADITIAGMGPGVVGTGTRLGFTGIEQGQILDAATALGGRAIACLRVSFADPRTRHQGVSHHTLTALQVAARERCTVVVPELEAERRGAVEAALAASGISDRHDVVVADGSAGVELLRARGLRPTSMGQSLDDMPELWLAAAAAGRVAAETYAS